MSMAAGEYVSVSSQSDAEQADLAREQEELEQQPGSELNELTGIYVKQELDRKLAREVAEQLMAKDALAATRGTSWEFPKPRQRALSRPRSHLPHRFR